MDSLLGVVGLVLGFSGLIFIHELGHFLLAKWNGVRVHVFSIGMGPYLISHTHNGTIYVLSMIPIGGYVKMLGQDDLNADLAENKNPADFRNKRPGQKAAILAAGAVFNILLTLVIYFGCYWSGMWVQSPRVGNIPADRALAKAVMYNDPTKLANLQKGDRIVRVNGIPVKSFFDLMLQVTACPTGTPIVLAVQRKDEARGLEYVQVDIQQDKKQGIPNVGLGSDTVYEEEEALPLGFTTEYFVVVASDPAKLEDSAAGKTGKFRKGDRIVRLEDRTDPTHIVKINLDSKSALSNAAAASGGKPRVFILEHHSENGPPQEEAVEVTPQLLPTESGHKFGIEQRILKRVLPGIDVNSEAYKAGLREGDLVSGFQADSPREHPWHSGKLYWVKKYDDKDVKEAALKVPAAAPGAVAGIFKQEYVVEDFFKAGGPTGGFVDGISQSWEDTRRYTGCMFATIRNLITRDVNAKNLSGPVGIGSSIFTVAAKKDMKEYMWWLAFISLNLGVMQLLPIPLLDGFHLVLVLIEKIKGSAVPAKIQEKCFYVGMAMVGSLLLFVMWNDIARFITKQ